MVKVFPSKHDIVIRKYVSSPHNKKINNLINDLSLEAINSEESAKRRIDQFTKILMNEPTHDLSWSKFSLQLSGAILFSLVATIPFSVVPIHNVFLEPSYWFESPLQAMAITILWAIYHPTVAGYYMNIGYIKKARRILEFLFLWAFVVFFVESAAYFIWTHRMGYQYPIPFSGYLTSYISLGTQLVTMYFAFPVRWRKDKAFQKRFKYFLLTYLFSAIVTIEYNIFSIINFMAPFYGFPQPIVVLLLPVMREFNIWVYHGCIRRCADGDVSGAQLVGTYNLVTRHVIMLCITLGSKTTTASSITLMAIDFTINIYYCVKIVWITKRKSEKDDEKRINLLQELALNELVEFLAPLSFLVTIVVAYYGPNSTLIGDVGNGYWQYTAIKDIKPMIKTVVIFFLVDFISAIVCALLLWRFCKINLFKSAMALEKEFWGVFWAIQFAFIGTVRNM